MRKLYEKLDKLDKNSKRILFTVLAVGQEGTDAGNAAPFGAKMLVSDGSVIFESDDKSGYLKARLPELLENPKSGRMTLADGSTVFTEIFENEKKLYVCGGGHCAIPVIKIAKMLGMKVTVLEDRAEFAEKGRLAGADEVLSGDYETSFQKIPGGEDSYFVVVTRGHLSDKKCVAQALKKKHAYCGMIGSKRHAQIVFDALKAEGFAPELVDSVYSPIGLNINAETPEEIAVSIMAQVIQVKNKVRGSFGIAENLLEKILSPESQLPLVIATIVGRSGSGPRQEGSKMLVFKDGSIAGTIGGGGLEAKSIAEAVKMLEGGLTKPQLIHFEMTNQDAYREGMVCGGTADVLLEVIS